MVETTKPTHWWWFDSHTSPKRSPWLHSTLADLDEKTQAMLKLIEEDADSFAKRAEMYYKKRPELINMVEEFYRAHRSLAVRFDQIKSEPRPATALFDSHTTSVKYPPFDLHAPFTKCQSEKLASSVEDLYDSYSENFDSGDSEIDDPEQDEEPQVDHVIKDNQMLSAVPDDVIKLREELEKLKEENRVQKDQLMQKDEEKREVIRQLSLAVEVLKEENMKLKRCITKINTQKKRGSFEFNILMGLFSGKLFNGNSQTSVVTV